MTRRKKKIVQVETTEQRHARIAHEAENLLAGGIWPDTIATTLNYANAGNLATKLKMWGYEDLSERFRRVNFDGLVAPSHRTNQERKRGASV